MDEIIQTYSSGENIPTDSPDNIAYLILDGRVRMERGDNPSLDYLNVLEPGEIIFPRIFLQEDKNEGHFVAISDVRIYPIELDNLDQQLENLPDWIRSWIDGRLKRDWYDYSRRLKAISRLYSICSQIYSLLYTRTSLIKSRQLKSDIDPVLTEIANVMISPPPPVVPILRGLSKTGLIDLQEGDILTPTIHITDIRLFHSFLLFLQRTACLPEGLYPDSLLVKPVSLSRKASKILDSVLIDRDIAPRMFDPERSMAHFSEEKIKQLYATVDPKSDISLHDPAIYELQQHGILKIIRDTTIVSVFMNLRAILRINILRNPEENFKDIAEFLCEMLTDPYPPRKGRIFRRMHI